MIQLPDISLVNGKLENFIPVSDRGLGYGDGLFETILYVNGKTVLLGEHMERLSRDCRRLRINLDKYKLKDEMAFLLKAIDSSNNVTGVVKIIVTRQFSGRGYGFDKQASSNRLLQYYAGLSYPQENLRGVRLSLCEHRLPDNKALAGIKHLNRLDQILAQDSVKKPFYQESIVFGAHAEVVECISGNIFLVKDGAIVTPDLGKAGVQGVIREYIISTIAPALSLTVRIGKIHMDDLMSADELFICNSVFGVWPVQAIHVKEYPLGKITLAIQKAVNDLGYVDIYR